MHATAPSYQELPTNQDWTILKEKLSICKRNGISYLASQMNRNGSWQCFETLAGKSDEWVTAYIGCCLGSMEDKEACSLAEKAHRFLSRRRFFSQGWGFNRIVPSDADSTAWSLRLNEILKKQNPLRRKYKKAQRLLLKHVNASNAVCTYRREGPIRHFTRLKKEISFDGWCGPHTCVTAAVANLEAQQFSLALDFLRNSQSSDGSWTAYWWTDPEYVTGLAVAALFRSKPSDKCVQAAFAWAFERMKEKDFVSTFLFPQGSCFATAWIIYLLSFSNERSSISRVVEWLLSQQRVDGSWNPSATLRIPPPNCIDPENYPSWSIDGKGGGSIIIDKNSVFTTSSVLFALENYSKKLQ